MNKQALVKEFHWRNKYPSGRYVWLERNTVLSDFILVNLGRVLLLFVKCLQRYANKADKHGDARLYRSLLHIEEAAEISIALANKNEVELADGIADLLYVTYGTADVYSIPADSVFEEVHRSNMSKKKRVSTDPRMRDKGDWIRPDIQKAITKGRPIC